MFKQIQEEFDEFQSEASKRLQQKKKDYEKLNEENKVLLKELEKCVAKFAMQKVESHRKQERESVSNAYGYQ